MCKYYEADIHDNVFIAAGRSLGYVITHDDVEAIRKIYGVNAISASPNSQVTDPEQVVIAVRFYVKNYLLKGASIKMDETKQKE